MPNFLPPYEKPAYFEQALFLYSKFSKFLDDDYARNGNSIYEYFENLVKYTSPFFYVIVENNQVAGFVYLSNIIGDSNHLHTAELTTCFDKKYWGDYTKLCASIFINFCFKKLGFKKIKALVYPDNFRVKTLLKFAGFQKEGLLKGETLRNNKLQDIEIYSCRKAEK
ncbi:GNAT family N-acetyltransferase [bacterium]|nr:GNAT family N-acetyltransferase [bacterium]